MLQTIIKMAMPLHGRASLASVGGGEGERGKRWEDGLGVGGGGAGQ